MLRPVLVIAGLAIPSFAWADCPVAGDLYMGITMEFGDDITEEFYTGADGIVVNKGSEIIGDITKDWTIQLLSGIFESYVYERTSGKWHPTTSFGLSYDFDLVAALPLSAGLVMGGVQTLYEDDFSEPATYSFSVNDTADVTIGDCSYSALEVFQSYLLPDGVLGITRMVYLKELGFGYIAQTGWSDGETTVNEPTLITNDG